MRVFILRCCLETIEVREISNSNIKNINIKKGYADRDFNRLHDSFSSLALININSECFDEALINELKIFILAILSSFLGNNRLHSIAVEYVIFYFILKSSFTSFRMTIIRYLLLRREILRILSC